MPEDVIVAGGSIATVPEEVMTVTEPPVASENPLSVGVGSVEGVGDTSEVLKALVQEMSSVPEDLGELEGGGVLAALDETVEKMLFVSPLPPDPLLSELVVGTGGISSVVVNVSVSNTSSDVAVVVEQMVVSVSIVVEVGAPSVHCPGIGGTSSQRLSGCLLVHCVSHATPPAMVTMYSLATRRTRRYPSSGLAGLRA